MGGVGVVFLLIFLAFLIYFFGGMIVLKLRGAEGLELIPHYHFWSSLPGRAMVKAKRFFQEKVDKLISSLTSSQRRSLLWLNDFKFLKSTSTKQTLTYRELSTLHIGPFVSLSSLSQNVRLERIWGDKGNFFILC